MGVGEHSVILCDTNGHQSDPLTILAPMSICSKGGRYVLKITHSKLFKTNGNRFSLSLILIFIIFINIHENANGNFYLGPWHQQICQIVLLVQ